MKPPLFSRLNKSLDLFLLSLALEAIHDLGPIPLDVL